MGINRKYAAFLSYAHKDEVIAQRVQKSLETYAVPKALKDNSNKLSPIFRDVTELTASHSLSDKISDAVENSRFLIVLCSPAAKTSHWVNEEIRLFRRLHEDASIFCALIQGTPETSFPPALTEGGREPLAADMTGQRESFKFGITQIAASMLGVGLDDLILRERVRQRRRVMAVTTLSVIAVIVMGTLTWTAMDARQEAEQRRTDAEGLIEFMLTDLKDRLESVGRLDALQSVGEKAATYYEGYNPSDHDDDALGRRARVFHYLGEIQDKLGNVPEANRNFQDAYAATKILLERNKNNPDRIFDHAQSAYWVADDHYGKGNFVEARPYYEAYLSLAKSLMKQEGATDRAQLELAYAHANLGQLAKHQGKLEQAKEQYTLSREYKLSLYEANPASFKYMNSLVGAYSKLADLSFAADDLAAATKHWTEADNVIEGFVKSEENIFPASDVRLLYKRLRHMRAIARLMLYQDNGKDAKLFVNNGLEFARSILLIEPKSVDTKYEEILLHFLKFEMAYRSGHVNEAYNIAETIKIKSTDFPEKFHTTRRYIQLESALSNIPIYLSILSGDLKATKRIAKQNLTNLPDNLSAIDSDIRYQVLVSVALINLVLSDPKTEKILIKMCKSGAESFSLLEAQVLKTSQGSSHCPAGESKIAARTIFQQAHEKYRALLNK